MKIKGVKPHVQPTRLHAPEPVKRFSTQSANQKQTGRDVNENPSTGEREEDSVEKTEEESGKEESVKE